MSAYAAAAGFFAAGAALLLHHGWKHGREDPATSVAQRESCPEVCYFQLSDVGNFKSCNHESAGDPADEDPFEKQMRLSYESQVRVSTVKRYGKPQALDQLEEWMKEKPIPYICNDKFSQEGIFQVHNWARRLSGHAHVNQTYPDVVRMWRQFHGCPACGDGIERVFF